MQNEPRIIDYVRQEIIRDHCYPTGFNDRMYDLAHSIYYFSDLGTMNHGLRMVYFFLAHGTFGMGCWTTNHRDNNPFFLSDTVGLGIEKETKE